LIQQTVKPTSPRDHSIIHLPEEKLPISDEVGHMNLDIRGIPHVLHHSVSINYNKEHVTSLCKTQVFQFICPCSNRHMQRRGDFYNHHIGGDWAMNQMKWVILELEMYMVLDGTWVNSASSGWIQAGHEWVLVQLHKGQNLWFRIVATYITSPNLTMRETFVHCEIWHKDQYLHPTHCKRKHGNESQ
jgi:hypothetical protein